MIATTRHEAVGASLALVDKRARLGSF